VKISAVHSQPTGPAFDVVLLLHVGCVVVGLATVVTSGAVAARLRRVLEEMAPLPEVVRRYFEPGVNWAGRTIYGIPIFGVVLLALSGGSYGFKDAWVTSGLGIFAVVVLLAEGVLWPSERRLQASLVPYREGGKAVGEDVRNDARAMALSATGCVLLLLLGSALMLAQP